MDDKFIKYDSVLGKLMDLNSKESLENPWTMVPRKTHDTFENHVYWEFQWHNPWEIQWGWKTDSKPLGGFELRHPTKTFLSYLRSILCVLSGKHGSKL